MIDLNNGFDGIGSYYFFLTSLILSNAFARSSNATDGVQTTEATEFHPIDCYKEIPDEAVLEGLRGFSKEKGLTSILFIN